MPSLVDNGLLQYGSSDPAIFFAGSQGQWAGADAAWLEKLRTEWANAAIFAIAAAAPGPSEALDIPGAPVPSATPSDQDSFVLSGMDAEGWLSAFSGDRASGDWLLG